MDAASGQSVETATIQRLDGEPQLVGTRHERVHTRTRAAFMDQPGDAPRLERLRDGVDAINQGHGRLSRPCPQIGKERCDRSRAFSAGARRTDAALGLERGALVDRGNGQIELRSGVGGRQRDADRMKERPPLETGPLTGAAGRSPETLAIEGGHLPLHLFGEAQRPRGRPPVLSRPDAAARPASQSKMNATRSGISSRRSTDPTAIGRSDAT